MFNLKSQSWLLNKRKRDDDEVHANVDTPNQPRLLLSFVKGRGEKVLYEVGGLVLGKADRCYHEVDEFSRVPTHSLESRFHRITPLSNVFIHISSAGAVTVAL